VVTCPLGVAVALAVGEPATDGVALGSVVPVGSPALTDGFAVEVGA
jgi:hypothetical protein